MSVKKSKGGFSLFWKHNKVFTITAASVLALLIALNLVATQVVLVKNTLNTVFGSERRIQTGENADSAMYYTNSEGVDSKEAALDAANRVNERICEEGFVLLKNEGALPLDSSAKISVFGMNSVDMVYGGSGSSARDASKGVDLYASLKNAGFDYNEKLKSFYDAQKAAGSGRGKSPSMGTIPTGFATGELPLSTYEGGGISGYVGSYADAALVVFSRIGGEGYDLPRTMTDISGANSEDHYLELDINERALLAQVCAADSAFKNVIVVINSSAPMELGFLDGAEYNGKIKGALWVGSPGGTGMNAFGRILNGEVNPSGRLVDSYARDFSQTPSWYNFGTNFTPDGNTYHIGGVNQKARFINYEEGIYVGYRYFETRGYTEQQTSGDYAWYDDAVVYPFGYGLSYSEFEWTLNEVKLGSTEADAAVLAEGAVLAEADKDKTIFLTVTVKNKDSSTHAGKDVVQLYFSAPYTTGEVEKSHVVLGDFAKTKLLAPGEEETLTLSLKLSDTASYDYADLNKNGKKTFEADAGAYRLMVGRNANDAWRSSPLQQGYELSADLIYDTDSATGTTIQNLFDTVSEHIPVYLSRSDFEGTFPTSPTQEDRGVSEELISSMSAESYIGSTGTLDVDKKWYEGEMPKQQMRAMDPKDTEVKLYDLIGLPYEDEKWDVLLDQLSIAEMCDLIGTGNFNTAALPSIGKPATIDPDGPAGFTNFMTLVDATAVVYDTCFYASECVMGATWNKELAHEMGVAVGDESLIGNERGDSRPYSGWYAPAANIHRSPFSGRNWEYYSEDGLLSGKMAANVVAGARSKGVYTYVKHFALNDQETDRDTYGLITWANEQAMRELYFKPFELAVKEGKTSAMMSSFNRIGTVWAGGNYDLLTELLRNQWGFRGMVITDYNTNPDYMVVDQMIRAGGDLNLFQDGKPSASGATFNPSHVHALRSATKNILYTVANSNAMNGMGAGVEVRYAMPYWMVWLFSADAVIVAALALWGVLSIRAGSKKMKAQGGDNAGKEKTS